MTDRERYHTRGAAFLLANDYQQCVKDYTAAIAKYPADIAARNQLALCLSYLRQLRQAAQVMREVVNILPSQPVFRDNLALYSNYAGDFTTAEQEARAVTAPDPYATLAQAFSQLGRGQWAEARRTYERLAEIGQRGRLFSASGLGDMAALEGRFSDAVRILRPAVADDLRLGDLNSAAAKLTAIASVELARNQPRAAVEAAEEALKQNQDVRTQFLAARTFAEAGDVVRAQPLIDQLASKPDHEPRAVREDC